MKKKLYFYFFFSVLLMGCGFHLQGEMPLAQPLHKMYIQAPDPYSVLLRNLREDLKTSNVNLVASATEADTILTILSDETAQELISVNGTQQTRQYNLKVIVTFEVTDTKERTIVPLQLLTENKTITVQSNQILGSSNEANLYYQQMQRAIAAAIVNRLASKDITRLVTTFFSDTTKLR